MYRHLTALSALALLTACGDGQPFFSAENPETGVEEPVDPTDPNTDVTNRFAFDLDRALTMNSVTYDAENDELLINNIPFDGPSQRYERIDVVPTGTDAQSYYRSLQTQTTGLIQSYAVFLRTDALEATAANGATWNEFGYGGANINRESFNLPESNEYVYVGVYSGVRTFSDRGGLELVAGDVEVLLDIDDLDPSGGIQGSILGTVSDRTATPVVFGSDTYALPDVVMARVSFDTEQGFFEDATATTYDREGDVRDSGTYEGLIAGTSGEEIGGYVILEGNARPQAIEYEVINWEREVNGVTVEGSTSALESVDTEDIQNIVDSRTTVDRLIADRDLVPEDATIVGTDIEIVDFETTYEARELGIFITEQVIPTE